MVCDDNKDLLMGYLDNELTDDQKRRFEEHLAGCPDCAGELDEFGRNRTQASAVNSRFRLASVPEFSTVT